MAKTLRLTVNFPLTIIVNTETVDEFVADRKKTREVPSEKAALLKGRSKSNYDLMISGRTDEEILEILYRAGLREEIRQVVKDMGSTEANIRVGDIKVTYEKPKGSCQGCIRTECSRPEGKVNAGCVDKEVGIRSPHFESRFEKTV